MRAIIQRVSGAGVSVSGSPRRAIGPGLLALLGVCDKDGEAEALFLAEKTVRLRIFCDEAGLMNRSLLDANGAALVVSNFTLYADCRKGRRPSFTEAARPEQAIPLYERFVAALSEAGVSEVVTGNFGADMQVDLVNDGPVTIMLDTDEIMPKRGR